MSPLSRPSTCRWLKSSIFWYLLPKKLTIDKSMVVKAETSLRTPKIFFRTIIDMPTDFALDDIEKYRLTQMTTFEEAAYQQGYHTIAGLDEAGRGPLAGPVVAAVCILPRSLLIPHVNDSKMLKAKVREQLFERLTKDPTIVYGVGIIDSDAIDRLNIYQATIHAMWQALNNLSVSPDYLLVDGLALPHPFLPAQKIIKGDQLSQSIAAASIIAKETRDRLMREYHELWPVYGFGQHKGYGTAQHLEALSLHGPCPIHRHSFEPIKSRWPKIFVKEEVGVQLSLFS